MQLGLRNTILASFESRTAALSRVSHCYLAGYPNKSHLVANPIQEGKKRELESKINRSITPITLVPKNMKNHWRKKQGCLSHNVIYESLFANQIAP